VPSGRRAWEHVIPFVAYPPEVRRVICTNAIESQHTQLRKIIKTRRHFPSDEAERLHLRSAGACCISDDIARPSLVKNSLSLNGGWINHQWMVIEKNDSRLAALLQLAVEMTDHYAARAVQRARAALIEEINLRSSQAA